MPKPSEIELKILKARIKGYSFCELSEADKRIVVDEIMFRGAAHCGCSLPQTELFAKYIAEEISVYIEEHGHGELTLEEILLAIRLNSRGDLKNPAGEDMQQVLFSGVCVNVIYAARILKNYKVLRDNFDRKLQNLIDGHLK